MTGTVPVRAIAQMLSLSIGSSTTLVFGVKSFMNLELWCFWIGQQPWQWLGIELWNGMATGHAGNLHALKKTEPWTVGQVAAWIPCPTGFNGPLIFIICISVWDAMRDAVITIFHCAHALWRIPFEPNGKPSTVMVAPIVCISFQLKKFIWGVVWWSPAGRVSSGDVKTSAVVALLKWGIYGLCEEVLHWRSTFFILERVSSRICVKNLTRRHEQKYWIKFLKDIQLVQTLRKLPRENRSILESRSSSLRGANITQVWSSFKNVNVPNNKPQASRRHETLAHGVKGSLTWNSSIKRYTKWSVELADISCCCLWQIGPFW